MTLTTHPIPTAEPGSVWPVLPALSAATSQQVFRACLSALSRPGTAHALPTGDLPAGVPAAALVPLALTDLMAPLTGLGRAAGLARRIATATGARYVQPGQARFAVALDDDHEELLRLPVGSNWSPEFGALLSQRVTALRQSQGTELTLTGPGIKDTTMFTVAGLGRAFFAARAELTAAFPTGVDLVLITDDGTMIGIPRTTQIEVG